MSYLRINVSLIFDYLKLQILFLFVCKKYRFLTDDQDLTYENYQLQASSCVPFDVSFLVNEGLHETDYLVAEMLEKLR